MILEGAANCRHTSVGTLTGQTTNEGHVEFGRPFEAESNEHLMYIMGFYFISRCDRLICTIIDPVVVQDDPVVQDLSFKWLSGDLSLCGIFYIWVSYLIYIFQTHDSACRV